jgi:NADH-quinone oxidoreductase subunit J
MSLTIHFFYLGFIGILVCTIMVVESRNSIYSIFFLLATFVFTALFLLGLGVEFLALNLVILYVGAIIILFLLIIMLVNQRTNNLEVKRTPVVGVISYMFLYFSLKMVYN